jgi:Domain of unknown function (DUF4345)
MDAERSLRAFFTVLGIVALVAGVYGAATGVGGMLGEARASASVDSELRFFAVSWAAYGALSLWVAPRVAEHPTLVRALAVVLFVAGLARVVSWADVGRPHGVYVAFMAIELLAPPAVWLGQRRLAAPGRGR